MNQRQKRSRNAAASRPTRVQASVETARGISAARATFEPPLTPLTLLTLPTVAKLPPV
jgi:hypothetical protein